jgi:hypothetical protein
MAPAALTVVPWHRLQLVTAAALWWLAVPGGALWQLAQVAWVPLTVVHTGAEAVPLVVAAFSVAPWHAAVAQLALDPARA